MNLEGALTWAFEFEDQPYFAGFRALATNGIDLPVLNVFRMFAKMGGQRVAAESSAQVPLETDARATACAARPTSAALASAEANRLAVMVWHYHDDDVPGPDAAVDLAVAGLPAAAHRGDARALPHRRAPQQRLRRVEADGLADRARSRAVRGAGGGLAGSLSSTLRRRWLPSAAP